MKRRRASSLCLVAICRAPIARGHLCDSCWRRLPGEDRRAIAELRAAGEYGRAMRILTEAAKALERNSPAAQVARRLGERQ
jgi:hypothetical protein